MLPILFDSSNKSHPTIYSITFSKFNYVFLYFIDSDFLKNSFFHVMSCSQGIHPQKNPPGAICGVDNKRTNANLAPFKLDLKTLDVF